MMFRREPAGPPAGVAVAALVLGLAGCAPPQQAAAPQRATATQPAMSQPAAGVSLARIEVREAQTLLGRLGYGLAAADGIVGPSSRAAAAAYRADMGAPASGAFDRDLLIMLRQSAKANGVATVAAPPPIAQRNVKPARS